MTIPDKELNRIREAIPPFARKAIEIFTGQSREDVEAAIRSSFSELFKQAVVKVYPDGDRESNLEAESIVFGLVDTYLDSDEWDSTWRRLRGSIK